LAGVGAATHGQAKANVRIAPLQHERAVAIIKVEVTRQLGWRGLALKSSVALGLFVREKVNGHGLSPAARFHR